MNDLPIDPDSEEWQPLRTLFDGYFHQDFVSEYGGATGAVEAFRASADSELRSDVAQAARALADRLTDAQAEAALAELDCEYFPPADGYSYRSWLLALAECMDAPR